jgi:hypothetical protein
MLEHFRVYPGQGSLEQLRRGCGIYMELVGLRGDVEAVSIGTNEIRRLIIDGCSALENEEMNELVERLGLRLGSRVRRSRSKRSTGTRGLSSRSRRSTGSTSSGEPNHASAARRATPRRGT